MTQSTGTCCYKYGVSTVIHPQSVPVAHISYELPPIEAAHLTAHALRQRFAHPPDWQPELRQEPSYMQRQPAQAAVLIGLTTPAHSPHELHVLLTQRGKHLSTHSGQIAFPGGKVDDTDANAQAAALREAHEEIGLAPERVEVIGQLPTYITGSAFWVQPVVALVQDGQALQPNPEEVDEVFEIPLSFLMNPAHHRLHRMEFEGVQRQWYSMPYPQPAQPQAVERFIWGATAGMLRNLYRFLQAPLPSTSA